MRLRRFTTGAWFFACIAVFLQAMLPCTSILVSRGATKDGSVMITYSADAPFMPRFLRVQGGKHAPGEMVDVSGWEDGEVRGQIPQSDVTYSVVGLMNEHQLALGETTTGGRRELRNPEGQLDYDALMWITLQRAKTAREAIQVIDQLARDYGYRSSGETFSIADPNEAWMMELIGKGKGEKGIVWVAARVPDGSIAAHANMSRITTFPLDDAENWRYAPDVVEFAVKKGFYDLKSGKPFSYRAAYHPQADSASLRACATRVWSIYRRAAKSETFDDGFHRGQAGAEDYPLFIKPDEKLSAHDVMQLMRDHYEGTPYDMSQGIDAGPFHSPYRFRGLTWKVDGETYGWERPISTQQAGFVMLSQCRGFLPDPVGGVYWYTPDDPYTSCFTPFYCGIDSLPAAYTRGDYDRFSWDSAWWMFNFVSNLAYDRWSRVFPDVQQAQTAHEQSYINRQPVIDQIAKELLAKDPALARSFLTDYAVENADHLFHDWQELATAILTKNVDGYVHEPGKDSKSVGYSEDWLREIAKKYPTKFHLTGKEPSD